MVTMKDTLLWTDGRYHLQASEQLDHNWTLTKQQLYLSTSGNDDVPSVEAWLSKELAPGAHIGYDPQLMSEHVYKKYSDAVECSGQLLVPLSHNLIDEVWGSERPPRPTNPLIVLATKYSGLQMASSTI